MLFRLRVLGAPPQDTKARFRVVALSVRRVARSVQVSGLPCMDTGMDIEIPMYMVGLMLHGEEVRKGVSFYYPTLKKKRNNLYHRRCLFHSS